MLFLIGYIVCGFAAFILYNIIGFVGVGELIYIRSIAIIFWPFTVVVYFAKLTSAIPEHMEVKKARKIAKEKQMLKDFMRM